MKIIIYKDINLLVIWIGREKDLLSIIGIGKKILYSASLQNNHQSPLVWGCMQDLTSWGKDDHEKGEESAQNYTGGSCQWL